MTEARASSLGIRAWGTARADLAQIAVMRKTPPRWAPEGTPGHFLKHADEQTVVAVSAVDRAIQVHGLNAAELRDWTIIAAPRFIGRLGGAVTLARFAKGGGPAISPHVIPQHSLHSVSGALSILLASRASNFGIGGGPDSLADGLFTAVTHPSQGKGTGTWLVCTAWEPEPTAAREGNCTNQPVCHAVVLALQSAAADCHGQLRLEPCTTGPALPADDPPVTVAQLCQAFEALERGLSICRFQWQLPWGAALVLEARGAAQHLSRAA